MRSNRFSLKSLLLATVACALLLAVLRFEVGQALVVAASVLFLPGILTAIYGGWYLGRSNSDAAAWAGTVTVYWIILLILLGSFMPAVHS